MECCLCSWVYQNISELKSPNREFLSGICNILHQTEQRHTNNKKQPNGICCFHMWRRCSLGFQTFGRTAGSSIAFYVLREPSHSNGSSEALDWTDGLCRPPPRRDGRTSISAALEDTAVALLAGSTLAISETSNPGAALWTVPVNVCCQAPLSPRCGD